MKEACTVKRPDGSTYELEANDRADVVARVFNAKKRALIKEIVEGGIFGHSVAYIHVVEFQKRGNPHIHVRD